MPVPLGDAAESVISATASQPLQGTASPGRSVTHNTSKQAPGLQVCEVFIRWERGVEFAGEHPGEPTYLTAMR